MLGSILHQMFPTWLYHLLDWPMNTGPNGGYNFWSGIGSDFGEITLIGGIAAWWHHNNCVERGCWRKGHKDPRHGHPVCRKHSPHLNPKENHDVDR